MAKRKPKASSGSAECQPTVVTLRGMSSSEITPDLQRQINDAIKEAQKRKDALADKHQRLSALAHQYLDDALTALLFKRLGENAANWEGILASLTPQRALLLILDVERTRGAKPLREFLRWPKRSGYLNSKKQVILAEGQLLSKLIQDYGGLAKWRRGGGPGRETILADRWGVDAIAVKEWLRHG